MRKLKVVELFAGVGGFRLGLEGYEKKSASSGYEKRLPANYEVVWSNQYEPLTPNKQHASEVYASRWDVSKKTHSNEDIEKVVENNFDSIPNHDLLVGGFLVKTILLQQLLKTLKDLLVKKGFCGGASITSFKKKGETSLITFFLKMLTGFFHHPHNKGVVISQ